MPFIDLKINKKLTDSQKNDLRYGLAEAIDVIPGKKNWLMTEINDSCELYFHDSAEPAAMISVSIYGNGTSAQFSKITGIITETVNKTAGVSPDRVYVKYDTTEHWGWNGSNF